MTHEPKSRRDDVLDQMREELGHEFTRVAQAEKRAQPTPTRHPTRIGLAVLAVLGILVPSAIAVAEIVSDEPDPAPAPLSEQPTVEDEPSPLDDVVIDYEEDGTVRVNGEVVDCPAKEALVEELGVDPCEGGAPAPAPLSQRP